MKRIVIFITTLILLVGTFACNKGESTNFNEQYYLYTATSSSGLFEDYFGIEDTKTKIFSTRDELNNFNNLLNESFVSNDNKFNLDIDFSKNEVAVTCIYCDNYLADISLSDLEFEEGKVSQNFNIEKYQSSLSNSSYGFLYVVVEKNSNLEFNCLVNETFDYDRIDIDDDFDKKVVYKPIIYFYPTKKMSLNIVYKDEQRLITTYPKYNGGWKINLNEDGTFTEGESDRLYYALYFDEKAAYTSNFSEGFYVTKDSAISFLEEKLNILGYTEREANECIMYWLPTLEANEKSLVYFETTNTRNEECPLEFSEQPDSILRTIIHIKKVSSYIYIKEQVLPTFERYGFCVVEWGGITY